jgi:hypothetical protein
VVPEEKGEKKERKKEGTNERKNERKKETKTCRVRIITTHSTRHATH